MQIDFFYNCISFIGCFYYSSLFFILSISIATKSFRTLPRRDCPDPAYHLTGSDVEVAYSCESLVLPLSETHFFTIHIISIRVSREEGRIEGERAGRIEGEQLYLIKQIIKRIIKNSPVSQIATDLLEPLDTIQPIYDLAMKQAPDFNAEKILNQLTSSNTSTLTK